MIINPLALASKGYVGNNLNVTFSFKGVIDLGDIPPPPSTTFGPYKGLYLQLYAKIYKSSRI